MLCRFSYPSNQAAAETVWSRVGVLNSQLMMLLYNISRDHCKYIFLLIPSQTAVTSWHLNFLNTLFKYVYPKIETRFYFNVYKKIKNQKYHFYLTFDRYMYTRKNRKYFDFFACPLSSKCKFVFFAILLLRNGQCSVPSTYVNFNRLLLQLVYFAVLPTVKYIFVFSCFIKSNVMPIFSFRLYFVFVFTVFAQLVHLRP